MHDRTTDITDDIIDGQGQHLRVLGPPGSGKTALLLERFRAADRAVAITYTRESRDSLTEALLEKNSSRFGRVPVFTYHRLADLVLGSVPAGAGSRVINELEESVLLRRLLRQVEGHLTSDYKRALRSGAFQIRILGVVNSMLQVGVGPEHRDALFASANAPRVRDLLTIFFEFSSYLRSHGYHTYHDVAWRAASAAAGNPDSNPLRDADVVLIDDFNDVDGGQYALIKALVPPDGIGAVVVFGDPTGARFRTQGTTDRYLLEVFPEDYQPGDVLLSAGCANGGTLGAVVDRLLENTLGRTGASDFSRRPDRERDEVDVSLTITEDEVAEASFIADRTAELVASGKCRPADIAVATRDTRSYESTLSRAFRERGLLLGTNRRPQHPFEFFVCSLLRLLDEPGNDAARSAVEQSTFFAALHEAVEVDDGDAGPVENVREAIQRATAGRNGSFDLTPLLERWLRPVLATTGTGRDTGGPDVLSFLGGLAEEWRTYGGVVDEARGRRAIREFLAVSRTLSGGTSGTATGRARLGSVGLYSVHELTSRKFPVVFVAGCSELVFPSLPRREDYIPQDTLQGLLRTAVSDRPVELSAARSAADFLRDEYALMLTALSRAGNRLILTSPKQTAGHVTPAPSRVLSAMPERAIETGIGRRPSVILRFAAAVAAAEATPPSTGELVVDSWHERLLEPRSVHRPIQKLSPSSLTTYTICPRKYFYARVLKIEGERTSAMAFGTAFHELMNQLSIENATHEDMIAAIRSKRLDELIEQTIADGGTFAGASELETESARHHLRNMALRFLDLDGARRDGYHIESSEQYLQFEHGGSRFHGVADRIDRTAAGERVVIDYKTGKIPKTGKTIRKRALAGFEKPEDRLWQAPIYARGAAPNGERYPEAFCYYVIRPDGDDVVVGFAVGEEQDAARVAQAFGLPESRIGCMSRGELEDSLDEAAAVAREVFADRVEFARTADRERCARCDFKGVCERTT